MIKRKKNIIRDLLVLRESVKHGYCANDEQIIAMLKFYGFEDISRATLIKRIERSVCECMEWELGLRDEKFRFMPVWLKNDYIKLLNKKEKFKNEEKYGVF